MYKIEDIVNKIHCADCLGFMKEMPDKSVDLVLTSPPYNCGVKYDSYNDNIEWSEYYKWCDLWISELYRLMKDDGRLVLIHYLSLGRSSNRQAPLMKLNCIAEDRGFHHHAVAIWWDITLTTLTAWGSWMSASAPYISSPFEGVLIMYKERWKKDIKGKSTIMKEEFRESCSGVWKIPTERDRTHPAPFPMKMANRCINLLSYEEMTVLDPFLGSGTTVVACKQLGRKFIGIEINKKYCEMAERRLAQDYLF